MSLATSNRDGGRTNEAGHLRGAAKGLSGQVLNGLAVSQRGAGANMSVDIAVGDAIIMRSDGSYGHPAWNDAVYNQVISAADGSNPRRDIIVMYIDYNETPSTGVANNTNGVVKIKSVSGTAAGSPVDPSNATIQSSVGSGNPFIKLARVRVAAGATSISNSVIDDLRVGATGLAQGGWIFENVYPWVYGSSTTFTIAGVDLRNQFPVGTKIRLYQGGTVKYFIVTGVSFSTNTTVTVSGRGTYTLANSPIDIPAFSYDLHPQGYPFAGVLPTDIDLFEDLTSSIVLKSGWTATSVTAWRYGKLCLVQGYFNKSSNISNGDDILTLPARMKPNTATAGSIYAAAKSPGTAAGTARANVALKPGPPADEWVIAVRTPSTTIQDVVFSLTWITDEA